MMQPARFIARLIGPAYLAVGIGILLNGSFYSGLVAEAVKSPTLIYFSGLLALVSGLAILNVHRSWSGWPVLITIIGWLLVIGGAVRLVLPATTAAVSGDLAGHCRHPARRRHYPHGGGLSRAGEMTDDRKLADAKASARALIQSGSA